MKRFAMIALAALALLPACDKRAEDNNTGRPAADNTKVNERDKDMNKTVTPVDQSNQRADLDTTQKIRQAIMADDTLSTDAKNVKIITANGVVTVRGPVKSDAERSEVDRIARQNAGANRVDNQVEVATK
jgi:hyperosmotically inducible protein